ncbi:hypothetical protein JY531_02430 [Serratia marcescens]|uniref:hypothetical protein n=1 Tax=Serratia nevei TaxID=2703794 RepID=UPI0018D6A680|nr:hypothetical protein [Serratia marcescens]MBH2808591.1 hypothetical protein [Serratia marcescens]MBN5234502.1 hypothetical protein [Serratia marcescens]MBN5366393.1 hypothetical protein [Serratia marcescens]
MDLITVMVKEGSVKAVSMQKLLPGSAMSALFAARQRVDYIVLFEEGSDYDTI